MGDKNNNLEIDSLLGHYHIISKIGAGGMGEVYLAEDSQLDRFFDELLVKHQKKSMEA